MFRNFLQWGQGFCKLYFEYWWRVETYNSECIFQLRMIAYASKVMGCHELLENLNWLHLDTLYKMDYYPSKKCTYFCMFSYNLFMDMLKLDFFLILTVIDIIHFIVQLLMHFLDCRVSLYAMIVLVYGSCFLKIIFNSNVLSRIKFSLIMMEQ